MKSSIFLASASFISAALALEFTNEPPPRVTLPRNTPIYVGEVTNPSGQNQIMAWLPTSNYCTMSSAVTEFESFSIGEEDPVAPRIDDLIFTGYNSVKASITREGKPFARCKIGPTSVTLGTCAEGEEIRGTWTCYVDEREEAEKGLDEEEQLVVPKNVAEPPPEFAGQGGTYQKWQCDDKGCKPQNE